MVDGQSIGNSFNPGDSCQLRTGGPYLTVESVQEGIVTVVWYASEAEEFRTTTIAANCLMPVIVPVQMATFGNGDSFGGGGMWHGVGRPPRAIPAEGQTFSTSTLP